MVASAGCAVWDCGDVLWFDTGLEGTVAVQSCSWSARSGILSWSGKELAYLLAKTVIVIRVD